MVQIMEQREKDLTLSKLAELITYFKNTADKEAKEKTEQLLEKYVDGQYTIAFCGHFSAGKSTMINTIVGEKILPSSPIPTSANLVKIRSGSDYTKVFYNDELPHLFTEPLEMEQLKQYCKNGRDVRAIELSYSKANLLNGVEIMDTPGIDSTDDAHRLSTESALHLADLIFYVMDYNHVQSEVNFLFVKQLIDAGKKVNLIVNQIDKHRDEELSFESFAETVAQSFSGWGINYENIYFTSLMDPNNKYNQFEELLDYIDEKTKLKKQLLQNNLQVTIEQLVQEHKQFLKEQLNSKCESELNLLSELSSDQLSQLERNYKKYLSLGEELNNSIKQSLEKFDNDLANIINNAYLMPYYTREYARKFIEAMEPKFKVGFLFSKAKTEEERANRLQAFYQALEKNVSSQLQWHIRDLTIETIKKLKLNDDQLLQKSQSFSIDFTEDLLQSSLKSGASLSGDYLLNYTEAVANGLKRIAKQAIEPIRSKIENLLNEASLEELSKIDKKLAELKLYLDANNRVNEVLLENEKLIENVTKIIKRTDFKKEQFREAVEIIDVLKRVEVVSNNEEFLKERLSEDHNDLVSDLAEINDDDNKETVKYVDDQAKLISKSENVYYRLKNVPGFKNLVENIYERTERLKKQNFTIALFGAFSAGKSSFANALIGQRLLPVSPNPTTATINKIMPPSEDDQDGTAKVKFKTALNLLADVNEALRPFNIEASSLEESLLEIEKLLNKDDDEFSSGENQYAFLRAFYKGYDDYKDELGKVIKTDRELFKAFVAEEEKSCLVETIEVYVDCNLTRQGVTIVDTPGADSINARHTNVSFNYIKDSDAFFYVTYYNHAFAKADREFLIQLGRLKDSFELDKMFFIVNAIDLASSEEELEEVINYVEEQLVTYGIRRPNLYPLSSLLGLKEKEANSIEDHSRIKQFEKSFNNFIEEEIVKVSLNGLDLQLNNVKQRLNNLLKEAHEAKLNKEAKLIELEAEKETSLNIVETIDPAILYTKLNQEADELSFYIKDRVFLRFNDFFRESINPAVIKNDRNSKQSLKRAFNEFLRTIGFEFAQEMRATTLRLENFIKKQVQQFEKSIFEKLLEINKDYSFTSYEFKNVETIEFEKAFKQYDDTYFEQSFSYFKNAKSFFEKNERQLMSDHVQERLGPLATTYLTIENERLKDHYETILNEQLTSLITEVRNDLVQFYDGLSAIYEDDELFERLSNIKDDLFKQ